MDFSAEGDAGVLDSLKNAEAVAAAAAADEVAAREARDDPPQAQTAAAATQVREFEVPSAAGMAATGSAGSAGSDADDDDEAEGGANKKRKSAHNEITRRSRAKVNDRFKVLLDILPAQPNTKTELKHKAQILDHTIAVMQDLILQNKTIKMDLALTSREALFHWVDQIVATSSNFREVMRSFMELFFFKREWKYGEVWFPSAAQPGSAAQQNMTLQYSYVSAMVGSQGALAKMEHFRESSSPLKFGPGEDVAGRVWVSMRPEWHSPVTDERVFIRASLCQRCSLDACMAIPLLSRGKMAAVIMLFDTMERIQDDNTIVLAMEVSARIGMVCGFVVPSETPATLQPPSLAAEPTGYAETSAPGAQSAAGTAGAGASAPLTAT